MDNFADQLFRFTFDHLPIRGQWVRLRTVIADANQYHTYPEPIRVLMAEQLAAVSMFADTLKMEGSVALQSRGEGALIRSLAECRSQHKLRAIAHLKEDMTHPNQPAITEWLGHGQLALTLIPDLEGAQTYQGMVELMKPQLEENLEQYFLQSEQLPTRLYFAHSDMEAPAAEVTGMLIQRLPDEDMGHEMSTHEWEEAWSTIETLAATLTREELATLPPERFLHRLFNEFSCRLHPPRALKYECTCSRTKTDRTLATFPAEDLRQLITERDNIDVDCEFCGARYRYDAVDVEQLILQGTGPQGSDRIH